ncbi:hypothetical protein [Bacterioplanoides sp.]|uniref:hypothetical protein n=1 Tax=Bacterioplanoides sp. TaxID=2066072 RepID=UPI003B5B3811
MKKMFIQPLATFAVGALISVQAMAFGGHQRGIDWEEELDLTEQQEEQIEAIEDRYQDQFHEMRKDKGQRHERHQQAAALMKQMRQEIQQVLTKEQRAQARNLMTERRHKAMEKRLKKLARKLDMTDEQKSQLKQTLTAQKQQYQWPMDQEQRQQARATFDSAMAGILTSEQQQQWQAMKAKFKKRWHHDKHHRYDEEYHKNSYDEHEHRGGLRKGYHSW